MFRLIVLLFWFFCICVVLRVIDFGGGVFGFVAGFLFGVGYVG